jgi:molybdenum cofactor cytidylyltransferase
MADTDRAVVHDGDIAHTVAAIVLAGGAGSRFSGDVHKLLAPLRGSTVIGSSLSNVLAAGFSTVIVVTGATSLPDALIRDARLVLVHNGRWSEGQASSLRVGIDAARALGVDAVVVGLGDQPFIEPEAWRRVAAAESPIAVASYAGRRGHPVKLDRSVWEELPTDGDLGARDLIRTHPDGVSQVDCPGSATDIDTQEDLERWT